MQTYAQRALQARIHNAAQYMANATSNTSIGLSGDTQYEPYYMSSSYNVDSNSVENKRLGSGLVEYDDTNNRTRTGSQTTSYDNTADSSL